MTFAWLQFQATSEQSQHWKEQHQGTIEGPPGLANDKHHIYLAVELLVVENRILYERSHLKCAGQYKAPVETANE